MRFFLAILAIIFYTSSLSAKEPSFKFTFGSNLGSVPIEINKVSKNIKKSPGVKINSWILSPNLSSLAGNEKVLNSLKNKNYKNAFFIKFNLKF